MSVKKLLWTCAVAVAATAFYLVVRRSLSDGGGELGVGYVGNEASGVFHRLECRLFRAGESSPVFVTRQQAFDAGYRPCGLCKP